LGHRAELRRDFRLAEASMLIGIIRAKLVGHVRGLLWLCVCVFVGPRVQQCAWLSYNSISLVVQPLPSQDGLTIEPGICQAGSALF